MAEYQDKAGLSVDRQMIEFVEREALSGLGIAADSFWTGLAALLNRFEPDNRALLAERERMQSAIDRWHRANAGRPHDADAYRTFLSEIGYLVPEPAPFTIGTTNVDPEIAIMAGPQLVVPALNARFALNAANARWGSLYDALYGTDVLEAPVAVPGAYDEARGAAVVAYAKRWLTQTIPDWEVPIHGRKIPELVSVDDGSILYRNNGLHIELVIDPDHPVGRLDPLGIADVRLEAALTTIIDLEDSVAAVDAEDKVAGWRNWLGLMRGDLSDSFLKNGVTMTRELEPDRKFGDESLAGRSLLFVRNVGHLMTNPAVLLPDGSEAHEGLLDAVMTSLCAMHDLRGLGRYRNSRAGSIYIVKPKMHGPDEAAFANRVFDAVEDMLDLPRHTIKVGVMDEERRTSANLSACIYAVKDRIVFINTGFLDRTGDEIHTSIHAGPMIPKGEMKTSAWITAYEDRNVRIGLACGLSGRAQIGKGMWAMPDLMRAMVEQKIAHPLSGANTAWVPSPTAATLHAMHYHAVDVFARRVEIASEAVPELANLLNIPVASGRNWTADEVQRELQNNCQGILGYVVRWVDQGVGCSKVPDINDIGLMEDRATLRIASQALANWLLHGVCTADDIDAALDAMAAKVNAQNAGDPAYVLLTRDRTAFQAARELIFAGVEQPSGYTEPLLHAWRQRVKAVG